MFRYSENKEKNSVIANTNLFVDVFRMRSLLNKCFSKLFLILILIPAFGTAQTPPDEAERTSLQEFLERSKQRREQGLELGDPDAQYNEAQRHHRQKNYSEAAKWFRRAAEQGHTRAQSSIGVYYNMGQGGPQDYAMAAMWYRKAAEKGDPNAQNNLGVLYYRGDGVLQNYVEAVKWYRLAAEQWVQGAWYNLGTSYDYGHGVRQDYVEATRWYRKAAVTGHADAQTSLGVLYYNGDGVLQDYVKAHMWFNLAATNGASSENRRVVADRMTQEQIAKAQAKAQRCFESAYQDCD